MTASELHEQTLLLLFIAHGLHLCVFLDYLMMALACEQM